MRLRVFGQHRARHALQGNVDAMGEILETLGEVGQPGTGGRQVRRIDLRQVPQADHLGASTGTGDDGFHLVRGEVLAFVDQDQTLLETAPANVVERFELQRHHMQDVVVAAVGDHVFYVLYYEIVGDIS